LLSGAGRVASFRRRGGRSILVGAGLLLIVLVCSAQIPRTWGAGSSSASSTTSTSTSTSSFDLQGGEILINQQQFAESVPSYAVLGTNYTLRVAVQSTADEVVPIIVQVSAPVDAIFVHPRIIKFSMPPMGSTVANFTVVPFGPPHTGPYNVTALVFVFFPLGMSSPQLVDQVTVTVSSIGPNPFPYLEVALISAAVVTLALVVVFRRDIFGVKVPGP
jgi:hypothetical protein